MFVCLPAYAYLVVFYCISSALCRKISFVHRTLPFLFVKITLAECGSTFPPSQPLYITARNSISSICMFGQIDLSAHNNSHVGIRPPEPSVLHFFLLFFLLSRYTRIATKDCTRKGNVKVQIPQKEQWRCWTRPKISTYFMRFHKHLQRAP
jgi:hypothetical protein